MTFVDKVKKLIGQFDKGLMTQQEFSKELRTMLDENPPIEATPAQLAIECNGCGNDTDLCACATPAQLAEAEYFDKVIHEMPPHSVDAEAEFRDSQYPNSDSTNVDDDIWDRPVTMD